MLKPYKCSKCGGSEPVSERTRRCKPCHNKLQHEIYRQNRLHVREHQREYDRRRRANPESLAVMRETHRKWRLRNKNKTKFISKSFNLKARAELLRAYGGKCECCAESKPQFLGIDHIGGGGSAHRREIGVGAAVTKWLRKSGYPRDKFRLLCHNCNLALGLYGFCHPELVHGA